MTRWWRTGGLAGGCRHGDGRGGGTAGGEVASETGLAAEFPGDFRKEVAGSLVRLAAVIEPLRDLGADVQPRPPARLTCLSLEEGPRGRDGRPDGGARGAVGHPGGNRRGHRRHARWSRAPAARPAVVLAGADEQATRHLARLTAVCERYDVPLVRTFSRLTEESARHLDTRNTAFMRLATRAEALRAAEHIGLERSLRGRAVHPQPHRAASHARHPRRVRHAHDRVRAGGSGHEDDGYHRGRVAVGDGNPAAQRPGARGQGSPGPGSRSR